MTTLRFAIVVEGEVAHIIEVDENFPSETAQRLIASLQSSPTFVESDNHLIGFGWTWDGTTFSEPVQNV